MMRKTAVVLLAIFLVAVVGFVGCGESEEEVSTVKVGGIMDLSGPSSYGILQAFNGVRDYVQMAEDEGLLSGVDVEWVLFDHGMDYSKIPEGYASLKSAGVDMIWGMSEEPRTLQDRVSEDSIPMMAGTAPDEEILKNEWIYYATGPMQWDSVLFAKWIMESWDYANGIPDLGFIGMEGLSMSASTLEGLQDMCDQYPDKLRLAAAEEPPRGTVTFAAELAKLKDCDYILITIVGAGAPSFIKEARATGYEGELLIGYSAGFGFWGTLKSGAPEDSLDGLVSLLYYPWWDDDFPFITEVKDYMAVYRPNEYEELMTSSGRINGWALGKIMVEAINKAAETVGAENIDGPALREALEETNIEVAGWPEPWGVSEDLHAFFTQARMYRYSATRAQWEPFSGWLSVEE